MHRQANLPSPIHLHNLTSPYSAHKNTNQYLLHLDQKGKKDNSPIENDHNHQKPRNQQIPTNISKK